MNSFTEDTDQWAFHPKPVPAWSEIRSDIEPTSISRLNDIALLIKTLTYGELIGLAKELARFGPITDATLPDVLWNWSQTHGNPRRP